MRIIPFLAALTVLLAPALASAQVKPYIEGQIGLLTSIGDTGYTYTNSLYKARDDTPAPVDLMGDLEHDADISFGAEIGVGEIAGTGFRVGLSYSQFGADSKVTSTTGTVGAPGTNNVMTYEQGLADEKGSPPDTEPRTTHLLRDVEVGTEFEVTIKVLSLNVYHDFDIGGQVMPYVGLGIGQAEIELNHLLNDDQMALSVHAGANYDINENFYVGARASFHQVSGPSWVNTIADGGVDDFNIWSLGFVGGVRF